MNCHTTAAYYHKYDDEMTISIWRSLAILRDDTAYLHTAIHQWYESKTTGDQCAKRTKKMTLEWYYMEKIHVYTAGSRDRVIWFTGRQNYVDLCKRRISNCGVFPYDKGILCILTCCRLLIMCEWLILIDWLIEQVFDLFIGKWVWRGDIHTCIRIWI